MNGQPKDRVRGMTKWGGVLTEWDMRRAARMRKPRSYDRGLPADDIDASLYHVFAAGARTTELLVKLAREEAKAETETERNAGRPRARARVTHMEAEAG